MAIRQYIGARYVPRFLGTYDVTQIYDALDVVDNGSGTSYIARKTVPAGTSLTNTDYWFVYGASSGAIYDLQTRMGVAENDIDAAETNIINLQKNKAPELKDRVFLFMSDSYQVQTEYVTYAADFINCKESMIKAYTGAGFYKHNSAYDDYTFLNILQTISPLTAEEKAKITDVAFCVACGNDNTDVDSDLTNAMGTIDTYLRAQLPNLRAIRLYSMGWATNHADLQTQILRNIDIYQRITSYLGWIYVDCTRVLKSGTYQNTTDAMGYHPDTSARYPMAYALAGAILSGSCQYTWNEQREAYFTMSIDTSAWGAGATIYRPSDGVLKTYIKIGNNGDIMINQDDFPIRVDDVSVPANNSYFDINLTPTQANRNPIPIGASYQLGGYGDRFVVQNVLLMRTAANSTKIRVFTYSTAAVTGKIHVVTTPVKIL